MDRPRQVNLPSALQAEQVQLLYRNMPTGVIASALNAAILAAVEWPVVSHPSLLVWVGAVWVVAALRAILIFNYRRATPSSWGAKDWQRWMFLTTALSGIGWGSSVYFFAPEIPLPYELVQIFVLGGMTAGAVSVLSVSFPLFISYALPVTLPLLGHLFLSRHEFSSWESWVRSFSSPRFGRPGPLTA